MQRPQSPVIKRPRMSSSDTARTPKQAAMQLVRLEFEIDRLERAINDAQKRSSTYEAELASQLVERSKLMAVLSAAGETRNV